MNSLDMAVQHAAVTGSDTVVLSELFPKMDAKLDTAKLDDVIVVSNGDTFTLQPQTTFDEMLLDGPNQPPEDIEEVPRVNEMPPEKYAATMKIIGAEPGRTPIDSQWRINFTGMNGTTAADLAVNVPTVDVPGDVAVENGLTDEQLQSMTTPINMADIAWLRPLGAIPELMMHKELGVVHLNLSDTPQVEAAVTGEGSDTVGEGAPTTEGFQHMAEKALRDLLNRTGGNAEAIQDLANRLTRLERASVATASLPTGQTDLSGSVPTHTPYEGVHHEDKPIEQVVEENKEGFHVMTAWRFAVAATQKKYLGSAMFLDNEARMDISNVILAFFNHYRKALTSTGIYYLQAYLTKHNNDMVAKIIEEQAGRTSTEQDLVKIAGLRSMIELNGVITHYLNKHNTFSVMLPGNDKTVDAYFALQQKWEELEQLKADAQAKHHRIAKAVGEIIDANGQGVDGFGVFQTAME